MAHKDVLGMASWVFMMVLPSINYVIFPLAQTLASPDLRSHVFGPLPSQSACSAAARVVNAEEGEEGGIEMQQVVPNGNAGHI